MSLEQQSQESEAVVQGIIGELVGLSRSEQNSRLEAASKGATDLSALVRRKPAKRPAAEGEGRENNDEKRTRLDDPPSSS